ncbi:hypothetical protein EBU24_01040 [bacterium]|nr:hypothetical protein [bacterium]
MRNVIQLTNAAIQNFNVNINNTLYTFNISYNARFDFWVLSLYQNSIPLFEAFKLVQGVDIGAIFNLPINGVLYIESISGDLSDPTRANLGNDMRLIYDNPL